MLYDGHKTGMSQRYQRTTSAMWLFPYQEFDSQAIIYLRLQSQICHKSLAQPFTNKWTNKGCSKNSTGFSNSVAT
jgi:hypothetical protein